MDPIGTNVALCGNAYLEKRDSLGNWHLITEHTMRWCLVVVVVIVVVVVVVVVVMVVVVVVVAVVVYLVILDC